MGWLAAFTSIAGAIIGTTPETIRAVNSTSESRPEALTPPSWMPGAFYPRGKIINYGGTNFVCYQDHVVMDMTGHHLISLLTGKPPDF